MNPAPKLPSAPDIPLHDIKPLVEVPDYTFTMFIAVVMLGIVLFAGVLYLLWKFWQRRKEVNERQRCFEQLQNVDVSDAKQAAYAITQYGRIFAEDSPRCEEAYTGLISRLTPYKYKKSVDPIDEETLSYYRIYVGMIDV